MCGPADLARDPSPHCGGRVLVAALVLLIAGLASNATAGKKKAPPAPPPLPSEHHHPSGGFAFHTPEGWKVESPPDNPETLNAAGDNVVVRFIFREGENGYDSLHGACMLERLAPAMDMQPVVQYEYDYVGGLVGNKRALDSAFVVTYDKPIFGANQWRQRNVTIVGDGVSLCAITFAPLPLWKKSPPTRVLLDAVLGSVTFK
jgi:hypothetical protein